LKKNKYFWALLCFALSILWVSCDDKSKTEFTEEEQILYDSLKHIAFKNIREKSDTFCTQRHDSLFAVYVDSLIKIREVEVKQLFEE
jgi:hypothetical protein